jgi:hypothetical protein
MSLSRWTSSHTTQWTNFYPKSSNNALRRAEWTDSKILHIPISIHGQFNFLFYFIFISVSNVDKFLGQWLFLCIIYHPLIPLNAFLPLFASSYPISLLVDVSSPLCFVISHYISSQLPGLYVFPPAICFLGSPAASHFAFPPSPYEILTTQTVLVASAFISQALSAMMSTYEVAILSYDPFLQDPWLVPQYGRSLRPP